MRGLIDAGSNDHSTSRAQHERQYVRRRVARKRTAAGQHLEQDRAEREDIAAPIGVLASRLLRRHICRRAEQHADAGHERRRCDRWRERERRRIRPTCLACFSEFREAEVEYLYLPVRRDLDVRRFQIAMNDALLVRAFKCLGDLFCDRQRLINRNRTARDAVGKRLAFDQFHHECWRVSCVFNVEDGGDVWMIERREDLRFALKPREAIRIVRQRGREDFDGDVATELCIARTIHLAHAASPDGGKDLVRSEAGTGSKSHLAVSESREL
jgi:hypothetical protein